jgi:hypothetical protein
MRLLKILFVLSATILFAVLAIFPVAVQAPPSKSGILSLPVSQPSLLTADGSDPVPIPWHKVVG